MRCKLLKYIEIKTYFPIHHEKYIKNMAMNIIGKIGVLNFYVIVELVLFLWKSICHTYSYQSIVLIQGVRELKVFIFTQKCT